ncbi:MULTISPECIES: 60S ribosomal export protein NMD3 [Halostella]|nr:MULTISPECIES: 60S ribosomal export protein NMD3 [Halostella]
MAESKLCECPRCGRLVNRDVNRRCPECRTSLTDSTEVIEQ